MYRSISVLLTCLAPLLSYYIILQPNRDFHLSMNNEFLKIFLIAFFAITCYKLFEFILDYYECNKLNQMIRIDDYISNRSTYFILYLTMTICSGLSLAVIYSRSPTVEYCILHIVLAISQNVILSNSIILKYPIKRLFPLILANFSELATLLYFTDELHDVEYLYSAFIFMLGCTTIFAIKFAMLFIQFDGQPLDVDSHLIRAILLAFFIGKMITLAICWSINDTNHTANTYVFSNFFLLAAFSIIIAQVSQFPSRHLNSTNSSIDTRFLISNY